MGAKFTSRCGGPPEKSAGGRAILDLAVSLEKFLVHLYSLDLE